IAALRTPGCTTATRATGSTRTARMNFAIDSSTPSPGGSAPPESPVPAPRGTTGIPIEEQTLRMRCTCSSVSGSDHHRQLAIGGEAVAFVGPGGFFLVENRAFREELAQGCY